MGWVNSVILVTLAITAYTDLKERKVSNRLVLAAFILVLPNIVLEKVFPVALYRHIPVIFLIIILYWKSTISGGDAKLLILISLAVLTHQFLTVLFITFVVGIVKNMHSRFICKQKIEREPLAPGMLIGFLAILIF